MTTNKDCLIYMRTSTLTNKDGDSVHRQKSSIIKWLKSNGYSSQIEFFFYIYKSGLNCNEIPIKFRQRFKGNSKIPRLEVLYSALKLIELFIKRFLIKKK